MIRSFVIIAALSLSNGVFASDSGVSQGDAQLNLLKLECEARQRQRGETVISLGEVLECLKDLGYDRPTIRFSSKGRF